MQISNVVVSLVQRVGALCFAVIVTLALLLQVANAAERPNFIVLVADDLGYSDLGMFGSEISTPNLDGLARAGTLLTNFHTGASCGPTRAMLMAGMDHHLFGMGVQTRPTAPEHQDNPHYVGYMRDNVVTLAQLMRDAGYHTYMAGKWHLGRKPEHRPNARGFERSFTLAGGGASHFHDAHDLFDETADYWEDDKEVDNLPADFYSSRFYTDQTIKYIASDRDDDQPFFSYLAYTSVHWPIQVPDDWLDRYAGRYDAGWDVLRAERLARMKKLGVIAADVTAHPRHEKAPAWETLSTLAKQVEARKMELYAAMVENLDFHIGRLIAYLQQSGQFENTFILFFSDNGAEGNNIGGMYNNPYWLPATFDNRLENMGQIRSYLWMGPGWSQVSALPHRMYKAFVSQGGIRVPAFALGPGVKNVGGRSNALMTVMDVLPTGLELAGHQHPGTRYRQRTVLEPTGLSLLAHLYGEQPQVHDENYAVGWELAGRNAYRHGHWKILWLWEPYGPGRWELFNLAEDPGETRDLAAARPEKLTELIAGWEAYGDRTGVVVLERDEGYGRN